MKSWKSFRKVLRVEVLLCMDFSQLFLVATERSKTLSQNIWQTYFTVLEYRGYSHDGILPNICMPVI
jgi:hypothetical protein